MPFKILVVDDEPDLEALVLQKFRAGIKSGDLAFDFAHNGVKALDKLAEQNDFDLILTDINMPEMDGLTLLNRVKELGVVIKTVVVSAYGDLANIRSAMNKGAYDFITKPIDFDDLRATIEKATSEMAFIRDALMAKSRYEQEKSEKEKAQHMARMKQEFLANMSHEIRTPMNAIMGMSDLLANTPLEGKQKDYINAIRQSSRNLLVIINDILDLSKIEAGKMTIEKVNFDFREQMRLMKETFQPKCLEKNITLSLDAGEDIPQFLVGDPTRLGQILINLMGNAVKFTEQGGVKLTVKKLDEELGRVLLRFDVSDTGVGIPPDKIDGIFESFTQAENSTTRRFGGTGLGLTITKKLLELQEGTISVTSETGKGSTFTVTIPYEIGSAQAVTDITNADATALKGIRILLAEDNVFNQMVAEDTIRQLIEGVHLEIANNGREAVDMHSTNTYDVILMDVQMPEMDGLAATKAIREMDGKRSKVPIVAMTASVISEEVERFKREGMDSFIPKPFTHSDLINGITQALAQHQTA